MFYLMLCHIHCNLFQNQIKANMYDGLYQSADFIVFHYFAVTAKNAEVDCSNEVLLLFLTPLDALLIISYA